MMEFDVAAARRVGERWGASDAQIGAAAAGVLLLQACDEIERLRKIRSPWGDDPSGPYYSDEYLEGLKRREEFDQKAREGVIDLNVLYPPTP